MRACSAAHCLPCFKRLPSHDGVGTNLRFYEKVTGNGKEEIRTEKVRNEGRGV
jgi:hypothetical protein